MIFSFLIWNMVTGLSTAPPLVFLFANKRGFSMVKKFRGEEFEGMSRTVLIKGMRKHPGTNSPHVGSINWRLSLYRLYLGLNQRDFASLIGLSQGSMCDIESGKSGPSCGTLQKFARIKEKRVDIFWLLTGEIEDLNDCE